MAAPAIDTLPGDPRAFFARFDSIVLVANSPAAAEILTESGLGKNPLFIFFNKVFRIIDRPFEGNSVLVSRSSPVGSSLIYRKELPSVLRLLDGPNFQGILNIKANAGELLSPKADFGRDDVANLDLVDFTRALYPQDKRMPSTGFALAVWLAHLKLGVPIRLAGFSGMREDSWRVYDVHDWTWEQIVLQLFYSKGLLVDAAAASRAWPVEGLLSQFDGITPADFQRTASQVLSERLGGANRAIDLVFRTIKPQLAAAEFIRKLRPKSRKAKAREKLLERIDKSG